MENIILPQTEQNVVDLANEASDIFWVANSNNKVTISPVELYEFLSKNGFGRFFPDQNLNASPYLVFEKDNIVEITNKDRIFRFCTDYIRHAIKNDPNLGKMVLNAFHNQSSVLKELSLNELPKKDYNFISDSADKAVFCFANGVVEVSADKIELVDYQNYQNKVIWKSKIIDRTINILDESEVTENSVFYKFLTDITSNSEPDFAQIRLNSLKSLIGYLLHRYKDPSNAKAIIFMEECLDDMPNGGTGKGLIMQGIAKVRNTVKVDGKNYLQGNQFALQMVTPDTDILFFDDIKREFNFERLFPLITEGASVEKKFKDRFNLPFEESPKVAIATNYAVKGEGSSFERRRVEFELSNYYNESFTPIDKYQHTFFNDWDESEWNLFHNTLFQCVMVYLNNGTIKSEPINIKKKRLISETSPEFVHFFENHLKLEIEYDKKMIFNDFVDENPDHKFMKQRQFTNWLKFACKAKGLRMHERHSDSTYYFSLLTDTN